jgi:hypothetical protein
VEGTKAKKKKTIPSGLLTQKVTTCNHSLCALGLSYELLDQSTYCKPGERFDKVACRGTTCNRVFVYANKDPVPPGKIAYKPSVTKPLYKCVNENSLNEDNESDNIILCTHALCNDCWSKGSKEMPPTKRTRR